MPREKKIPLYPSDSWRGQPYYTTYEVADILGVSHRTVQNYIKAGQLHGVKLGAVWRISEEEIDRLQRDGVVRGYLTAAGPQKLLEPDPFPPRIAPADESST